MAWLDSQGSPRFMQTVAAMLPGEGLLDLPQIQMMGNRWLQVENHRGIIAYSAEEVRLALITGEIVIVGRELQIERVDREGICLTGQIERLAFGQ